MQSEDSSWQEGKSVLERHLYMLENQLATDVCFEVGLPDSDKVHIIRAHRFVLVSASPVFERMLCGSMAEGRADGDQNPIKVLDIDANTFQEMLQYMYTDSPNITPATALPLMYAAKKYMVSALVRECQKVLEKDLSVDDVCAVLEQSRLLDEEDLMKKCLSFVSDKTADVLTTEGFFSLSRGALEKIVECDRLMLSSEVEVFSACTEWAKRKLQQESCADVQTDERIRETLGNVLFKIRFPTMSPTQFAESVGRSNVLTSEEQKNVYFYLITKEMPENLSFDTRKRQLAMTYQVVDRFSSVQSGRCGWNCCGEKDAIDFRTSVDMKLTAVGLYGGMSDETHDVTIEVSAESDILSRVTTQMISEGSQTPVRIPLSNAVAITADTTYTVAAIIRGALTFSGGSAKAMPIACGTGTITFLDSSHSTSGTRLAGGQIPQLFCIV